MNCPHCGRHSYVYQTFKEEGVVFRRRRCLLDHEIVTMETVMLKKSGSPPLTQDDIVSLLRAERGFHGEDIPADSVPRRQTG